MNAFTLLVALLPPAIVAAGVWRRGGIRGLLARVRVIAAIAAGTLGVALLVSAFDEGSNRSAVAGGLAVVSSILSVLLARRQPASKAWIIPWLLGLSVAFVLLAALSLAVK